jgi:hypothetical protein
MTWNIFLMMRVRYFSVILCILLFVTKNNDKENEMYQVFKNCLYIYLSDKFTHHIKFQLLALVFFLMAGSGSVFRARPDLSEKFKEGPCVSGSEIGFER